MNVYKVNDLWIAAKNADDAFAQYMEETDAMSHITLCNIDEGGEEEILISIKRLTIEEINGFAVPCCEDGCDECEDQDEHVYYTYQELIDKSKEFPCILAKEL